MPGHFPTICYAGLHAQRKLRRHPGLQLLGEDARPVTLTNPMPAPGKFLALRVFRASVAVAPLRLYQVDANGAFRAEGITFTAFDAMAAQALPRLTQSRRLTNRSRYSPRECFAKGNA